ncbi:MAG: glycosyltransferase family 39 protein [Bacteroidia bacterium]|nr:glycosyltransferase family 39 protein [Bacteroidia bacterium]
MPLNRKKIVAIIPDFILVFSLILLGVIYGYPEILSFEPQGQHHWRQTDCASFAWNYYHGNINLFTPAMNNVLSNGKGQAVAEFPIIYWIGGLLYRLLGPDILILRILNISIVFSGLWVLFRLCKEVIDDIFWAFFIPILLFSSPFFVYYTNGFIPDPPAIALCFWAWYFLFLHLKTEKKKYFSLAAAFFLLAALIKVSTAISLVSLSSILVLDKLFLSQSKNKHAFVFPLSLQFYIRRIIGVSVLIIAWYFYASWYSTRFEYNHFTGIIRPLFQTPKEEILRVLRIIGEQLPYFYLPITHVFFAVVLVYILWNFKKIRWQFLLIPVFLCLGSLVYLALFFQLIGGHEYYHLVNLVAVTSILITGSYLFNKISPRVSQHRVTKSLLSLLLIINIFHARGQMLEYNDPQNQDNRENSAFYEKKFYSYLADLGLKDHHYVISIPDKSPNNTLYLMKKRGWSSFNNPRHFGDVMQKWTGGFGDIYLIISDSTLIQDSLLQPALYHKAGVYKDIHIYLLEKNRCSTWNIYSDQTSKERRRSASLSFFRMRA